MNRLDVVGELLNQFEKRGVIYCHWKSNDHVEEGMCGVTDLDILVDRRQYLKVREALACSGFKQALERFGTKLPAVEGYLGFDTETGMFAYVHLHYRLVTGKNRVKEYHLPWEKLILDHRSYDDKAGIYAIDRDMEFLLLYVRAALKIRLRDAARNMLGKTYFSGNWARQKSHLSTLIDLKRCSVFCEQLLGADSVPLFLKMVEKEISFVDLKKFGRVCRNRLNASAAYGRLATSFSMWAREIYGVIAFFNRRFLGMRLPVARKTMSSGGVFIAIIGPDGSGKSTMTKKLVEWLGWKLDVYPVYLGAGDGSSSILRWIMKRAQLFVEKCGMLIPSSKANDDDRKALETSGDSTRDGFFYWAAKTCWAMVLCAEKKSKLKSAWRARNQGIIVVADRYPQTQIEAFNDGPLLGKWLLSRNWVLRGLANWERKPYGVAHQNPPDLVIRLNVTPETALARDAEMDNAYIKRRILAVKSLFYPPSTRVVEVDANGPIERVFRDVCREVWCEI